MKRLLDKIKNKIIWKIILIFWLTTFCIITANILITTEIVLTENKIDNLKNTMRKLASEGVSIYETEGQHALQGWYKTIKREHGLRVLLEDRDNLPVTRPHIRPHEHHTHEKPRFFVERRYFDKLLALMSQPFNSASGEAYTLALLPSRKLAEEFRPPALLHVYRLSVSFLFILIGSWWLARSVSRPVEVMKEASLKVAEGNFDIHVVNQIGSRKDELGQLAHAFDNMAVKIQSLLDTQKQLFSDISHDIRTPLTRQKLAIELAREADDKTPFLDKLETQNQVIEHMLDSLLTLLKLEEKNLAEEKEMFDLSDTLQNAIDQAGLDTQEKQLTLAGQIDSGLLIKGYEASLSRAFTNILSNAIKYSPDHGKISVTAKSEKDNVIVTVADHGPGIPEPELNNVTKAFYRADKSRNQSTGGYGLGLAITNKIMEQHSGELIIQNLYAPDSSNQPLGLSVSLVLPAQD